MGAATWWHRCDIVVAVVGPLPADADGVGSVCLLGHGQAGRDRGGGQGVPGQYLASVMLHIDDFVIPRFWRKPEFQRRAVPRIGIGDFTAAVASRKNGCNIITALIRPLPMDA